MAAAVIDAGIHGDAIQPGGELRVLAEAVEGTVNLDEHFLRNVLRIVVIARELIGDPVDHGAVLFHERLKGGRVAARGAG